MSGTEREPCPWRIIEDAGGAFAFGMGGGTIFHFVGGARNAPSGLRINQAIARVKARTPILGGSFAIWGLLFSCFECSISSVRKKEDPWNAIMSGAATGGLLAARAGLKAAAKNAAIGGVLLAAIEGIGIVISRIVVPNFQQGQGQEGRPVDLMNPPEDPLRPYRPPIRRISLQEHETNAGSPGVNMGLSGMGARPDVGGVSTKANDEFDFVTGKYKSEVDAEASERAVDQAEAVEQAKTDKEKGWW
jgi:mitochondrial import inner membrane translocase subunit TIM17